LGFTRSEKLPPLSVEVPVVVPFTNTLTPGNASLFSSDTFPFIILWAKVEEFRIMGKIRLQRVYLTIIPSFLRSLFSIWAIIWF
jgi:hypothetical protein